MKLLEKQFLCDLAESYDAERRIARVLPRMTQSGISDELRAAICIRAREIQKRLSAVEAFFNCFGLLDDKSNDLRVRLQAQGEEIPLSFLIPGEDDTRRNAAMRQLPDFERSLADCGLHVLCLPCLTEAAAFLEDLVDGGPWEMEAFLGMACQNC